MSQGRTIVAAIGAPDYPVLDAFMACRARVSIIRGPLGSGKTTGAVQRIQLQMAEQEPNAEGERRTRWLAIRNTYNDLTQTTIKDFLEVFDGLGEMRYGGLNPPTFRAAWHCEDDTTVRAEVIFLALDRPGSVRKLKGYQITGVWLNEACEIAKPIVDMADLRHGRYPSTMSGGASPTWSGMLGDTNSFDQDHWLYRAEWTPPEDWEFFAQAGGVIDTGQIDGDGRRIFEPNPKAENLKNLPAGYYRKGMAGKTDAWIRVMLANEFGFVVHGKPVHPAYVDSVHCAREPIPADPRYPIVLGFDFGRTPACGFLQYLEHVGRWIQFDELTSEDMSAAIFAPEVKRKLDRQYPGYRVQAWGDPAGDAAGQATEDTPILIVRAAGIPIRSCHSNAPSLRRAALDNPLTRMCIDGRPAYLLSPTCTQTRKAWMGGYHYRELQVSGPEARYADTPEKNMSSHIAEAVEYALLGGGEGREAIMPAPSLRSSGPVQQYAYE